MLLPAGKKLVGVKTFSVPTDLVELVVNMTIGQVQVHVDRGEGDSSVAFPPELGMQPLRFTIPDLEIDTIFGDAKEYPHDINSSEVRFQLEDQAEDFPRGFIRLVIEFEQRDEEIHGTWHGEMDNMKLRVDLALKTLLGKISYGDVRSKFTFDLNMIGVPGWALDPIFNYSDKIANLTEDAMVSIFDNGYVRGGFSARITEQVEPYLGPDPVIVGVRVTDGQLIIRYYNN